nr:glutathione synthase [Arenimonas sp.]
MALQVAVVMDPIGAIKIAKDTSFAMLLEAQRRGHQLHYVAPGSLGVADGRAVARLTPLSVHEHPTTWYALADAAIRPLAEMDVILMRTDPPVDANYLHDSILLSMAQADGVLVVNDPQGLRDLNEKLAALL